MTETVYKKDSKGKIRFITLTATLEGILEQESGIVGSENTVLNVRYCKGKNIGRSNETTAVQQARLELESKVKQKLSAGYFKTAEEAQTTEVILPMLAKDYFKEQKKINWEGDTYVQPKLDGMRCLAIIKNGEVTLMSRDGKNIMETGGGSMQHIVNQLSSIKQDCVLDGELYAHGYTFQENMRLIKKLRDNSHEVNYNIYDVVSDRPFKERNKIITDLIKGFPNLVAVITGKCNSVKRLEQLNGNYIEAGYEGTMVRHGQDGYKVNGRSSSLLKYKKFIDIRATLEDVVPSERDPSIGVPILRHLKPNGSLIEFRAGARLSRQERQNLLTNKSEFIGQVAEIRFFEWTDEGNPRFPVLVGFRLD